MFNTDVFNRKLYIIKKSHCSSCATVCLSGESLLLLAACTLDRYQSMHRWGQLFKFAHAASWEMNIQHFDDKASLFMHSERINLLALYFFFFPQHISFFYNILYRLSRLCWEMFQKSRKYECLMVLCKSFLSFNHGGAKGGAGPQQRERILES